MRSLPVVLGCIALLLCALCPCSAGYYDSEYSVQEPDGYGTAITPPGAGEAYGYAQSTYGESFVTLYQGSGDASVSGYGKCKWWTQWQWHPAYMGEQPGTWYSHWGGIRDGSLECHVGNWGMGQQPSATAMYNWYLYPHAATATPANPDRELSSPFHDPWRGHEQHPDKWTISRTHYGYGGASVQRTAPGTSWGRGISSSSQTLDCFWLDQTPP